MHPRRMGLRTTLEMLKRGEEINDALYRSTTRERRTAPWPPRAPTPWDRHRALVEPFVEPLVGRRLVTDAA